jgi:hypothetical protein
LKAINEPHHHYLQQPPPFKSANQHLQAYLQGRKLHHHHRKKAPLLLQVKKITVEVVILHLPHPLHHQAAHQRIKPPALHAIALQAAVLIYSILMHLLVLLLHLLHQVTIQAMEVSFRAPVQTLVLNTILRTRLALKASVMTLVRIVLYLVLKQHA